MLPRVLELVPRDKVEAGVVTAECSGELLSPFFGALSGVSGLGFLGLRLDFSGLGLCLDFSGPGFLGLCVDFSGLDFLGLCLDFLGPLFLGLCLDFLCLCGFWAALW